MPPTTKVTNLLVSPNDLSGSFWTASGGMVATDSMLIFDGTGNPRVYQAWTPLTAGHHYLFLVRANSASAIPHATKEKYPRMRLMCYRAGAGWITSDDNTSELGGYTVGLRSIAENHFARYTAPADGNYLFNIQDYPDNTDGIVVNYAFAAVYDMTRLSGIIVDDANPRSLNLDKQIHVWGDSLPNNLAWWLRERFDFVNATGHSFGGQTSSYVLSQFLLASGTWNQPTVIWVGHNNVTNVAQVESDIKAMTDRLTGDFRVLSLVYNRTWVYPARSEQADDVDAINAWLAKTYGSKYVDVKTALLACSDSSPQDVSDVANGLTPTSCRADDIHLIAKGFDYVADAITTSIGSVWNR